MRKGAREREREKSVFDGAPCANRFAMPPSHCSNSSRRRPPPSRAQQPRPPFFGSRRIPHNNHVGSPFAPGEAAPQAAAAAAAEERAERNGSEQGEQCGSPPPRCFFRFRRTVSSVRRALSARHLSSQISSLGDGALRWGLSRSVGKGGQQQGECALEREDEEEFFSSRSKILRSGVFPPFGVLTLSLSLSPLDDLDPSLRTATPSPPRPRSSSPEPSSSSLPSTAAPPSPPAPLLRPLLEMPTRPRRRTRTPTTSRTTPPSKGRAGAPLSRCSSATARSI